MAVKNNGVVAVPVMTNVTKPAFAGALALGHRTDRPRVPWCAVAKTRILATTRVAELAELTTDLTGKRKRVRV